MAKAKDLLSNLGVDVEMTSEAMAPDAFLSEKLRDIGKTIMGKQIAEGQEYVGTIAFHITRDKGSMAKAKYDLFSATQIAIDDISESLVTLAFNNGMIALRKYFHPEMKSKRLGDKR